MNAYTPPFTWSYSHLKDFETCPKRYYHTKVAKDYPETGAAMEEGKLLHTAFEKRLMHGTPLPLAYASYESLLERVDMLPGAGSVEIKLGVTEDFRPVAFMGKGVWCRFVIDLAKVYKDHATIFDWKTGRLGEDVTQLAIMAAGIMAHQPKLQRVKAALVFINAGPGGVVSETYTRASIPEIWNELLPRVNAIKEAKRTQTFAPTPNGLCRKYCPVTSCPFHGRGG